MYNNEMTPKYELFLGKKVYIEYRSRTNELLRYTGKVTDVINNQMFLTDVFNNPVSLELVRIKTCVVKNEGGG